MSIVENLKRWFNLISLSKFAASLYQVFSTDPIELFEVPNSCTQSDQVFCVVTGGGQLQVLPREKEFCEPPYYINFTPGDMTTHRHLCSFSDVSYIVVFAGGIRALSDPPYSENAIMEAYGNT